MEIALAQAERVRKGVTLGTENGSMRPRRAFEIRWGSDLIQKARDLQEAQNKDGREGPRQREGGTRGERERPSPHIGWGTKTCSTRLRVRPAGIVLRL